MQLLRHVAANLETQRGTALLWTPVLLACGIGIYFHLKFEPGSVVWVALAALGVFLLLIGFFGDRRYRPIWMTIVIVITGFATAKVRTEMVDNPTLHFRYYGPIEGRIVQLDRSASDAVRITLDQVVLSDVALSRTPSRVRVSLHGQQQIEQLGPGERVILTGHLSPPSGPAEPGGFDFQRHAFFDRLGAVGYTRTPVLRLVDSSGGIELLVFRLRMRLSRAIQSAMPGETGAFAAAIMTGDRAAMGQDTLAALRASNLAHLLAISGLHMGLLTGFVFSAARVIMASIPHVALHWPTKKIAAVCAIFVGFFYLLLSGGNVATERAYIMVTVMFIAVLLDRRALTLRAVSMAAILILILEPEALAGPGFQMSFAATVALVFVFGEMRRIDQSRIPKWLRGILAVVVSSAVAGFATAPFAAAHFGQFAHYGLIANLLSVPLMGALVMPAAVVAILLAPLGLWQIGLIPMEWGLSWILSVATVVSRSEGAVGYVVAPGFGILPLLAMSCIFLLIWRGWPRMAGLCGIAFAVLLWLQVERPKLLIADSGAMIGLLTDDGRALSRPRGSGFVARVWMENDGIRLPQDVAGGLAGLQRDDRLVRVSVGDLDVLQVSGKTALAGINDCDGADILVSNQRDAGLRSCLVLDTTRLRSTGAIAISPTSAGAKVTTARQITGTRPWNDHTEPSAELFLGDTTD